MYLCNEKSDRRSAGVKTTGFYGAFHIVEKMSSSISVYLDICILLRHASVSSTYPCMSRKRVVHRRITFVNRRYLCAAIRITFVNQSFFELFFLNFLSFVF